MQDETIIQEGGGSLMSHMLDNLVVTLITLGIVPYLKYSNSGLAVTDERVILKNGGLLGSNTDEVRLDNIQGVSTDGSEIIITNAAGQKMSFSSSDTSEIRNAINQAQSQ
jgi:uncharacterized membrane protein YdbT with pleckstrin-like domain